LSSPIEQTYPYDIIIGLEVHVQLLTSSKMFCGCATKFGEPPNTLACPVCIGMPGALPVMNRRAYELALKAALALNCQIARFTKWDRKNYYYPDLPKGYQISQYDLPLSHDGYLAISDPKGRIEPKRVGIIRVHLEEDAGKSMHDEKAGKADSRIDLNRAGTPLLEIVTRPDLRSPAEAKAFLTELKLLLNYLEVSDCNMQEGSLRVDANINLHISAPDGRVATPIVEVKNMNSFRAVERALAYEAQRQYGVWKETGRRLGEVPKETRGWDESQGVTWGQRSKEESSDYRYFPEPDLVPVTITEDQIEQVRQSLGEMPAQLRARLENSYGIGSYDSDVIANQGRQFAAFFERLAAACGDAKTASNWVQQDVLRVLNENPAARWRYSEQAFAYEGDGGMRISGAAIAEIIQAIQQDKLTTSRGREVFAATLGGKPAADVMQQLGIAEVEEADLATLARTLLESNPKVLADLKQCNLKAAGWLVGQAKKTNPNVNPGRFRDICLELVKEMTDEG